VTTNYKYHSTEEIFKKLKNYLHGHDRNSHVFSVKEYTRNFHGLHYHILYFTDKQLDYSRIHKHMPSYADINIQLVKKTAQDIQNVIKYMNKTKKCHKVKHENMQKRLSIFDFKLESIAKQNKVISRLTLFDLPDNNPESHIMSYLSSQTSKKSFYA